MIQGNLALKLEDFEDNYNYLYLVDDEQSLPDNIIQFPTSKTKDTLNRLATVTNPDSEVTTYTYDDVSNLTKTLYDSGAEANYTFSSLNRLLTLTNEKANEDVISYYSYTYDDNGMRTGVTLDNDDTIVYTYDAINQLTDEVKADSAAQELYSYVYSFDDAGNRLNLNKKLDASATNISNPTFWDSADTTYFTYTYDNENRLTQLTAEVNEDTTYIVDYTYDDNGNLTEKAEYDSAVQQDKDTTTYVYDYENRLTEIVHADSSTSEYTYDGAGKRIKTVEKNSQGTVTSTTKFLYDGLNVVIERNVSDETTAAYTRGLSYGGGIGGIISKKTSATTNYFHYDGIGTVTGLTDANESVVQTYIYEAYGNLLYSTGSEANNHQFSTKEHSANSGLSYFGARYYDPRIGRWTQKDPWGMIDGPNVYLYVNNNPVNWIDYWGFCKKSLGTSDSEVPNPTELAKFIPIVGTVGAVPTLASISWVPVIGWGVGGGLAVRKGLSYANKLYITNIHRQIIRDYFRAAAIVNKRYGSIVAAPEKIRKSLTYLRIDAMRSLQQIAGNVGEIPYKEISGAATGAGK